MSLPLKGLFKGQYKVFFWSRIWGFIFFFLLGGYSLSLPLCVKGH